jgi:hypothetical protein
MGFVYKAMLQQFQFADIFVQIFPRQTETFAVDACGSEEAVGLIEEDRVINWNGKLNVTGMTGAIGLVEVACGAPVYNS